MSNPVAAVFPLSSDLNGSGQSGALALTGVEPIRYDSGLWLEEAETNYCVNPSAETNTTGWSAIKGTVSQVATDPQYGTESFRFERTSTGSGAQLYAFSGNRPAVNPSEVWTISTKIKGTAGLSLRINIAWYSGANGTGSWLADAYEPLVLTATSTLVSATKTAPASAASFVASIQNIATGTIGDYWLTDGWMFAKKGYLTSYTDGDQNGGDGYDWSSTAHASASTRTASSASISPSGIIDTYLGAIVFRATPTVETGAEEIWGELGEKGAGTDHIRWGRDATKHPYVEWSGNDSAYTRITLTPTVDAGDEHFYSIEWHVGDADFRLYLDDNPSDNDTIPSPQEDYGAGPLKLQATAGGVIYNGLMICNERLTNAQRARLQDVGHWSVRTLERLRVEVARPQFELRPY